MRDPYAFKSAVPFVERKTEPAGRYGANMNGPLKVNTLTARPHAGKPDYSQNANEIAALDGLSKGQAERAKAYLAARNADATRLAKAEAKRVRKQSGRIGQHVVKTVPTIPVQAAPTKTAVMPTTCTVQRRRNGKVLPAQKPGAQAVKTVRVEIKAPVASKTAPASPRLDYTATPTGANGWDDNAETQQRNRQAFRSFHAIEASQAAQLSRKPNRAPVVSIDE